MFCSKSQKVAVEQYISFTIGCILQASFTERKERNHDFNVTKRKYWSNI